MVESGLLPEGSLSLLAARPDGLLEELTPQDTLGFTGSAATALALRTHPVVAGRAVRFNAEADSLNCSILGPDVTVDDPEFALYVDQLLTEMTVKAGQKCTAIRRALVPAGLAGAVADAVAARLADVVVGHPAAPGVQMGALASLGQRDEVRQAVARLAAATRPVFGDTDKVTVTGADAERGAFLSPILLRSDDVFAAPVHQVEAFGPVSTLLPYDDLDQAVAAAALGDGSLVASIVSADRGVAADLAAGWRRGTGGSWCWTGPTRPNPPGTAWPCPRCCTAVRAGREAARNSAGSARSGTTCSGPRCRATRTCWPCWCRGRSRRPKRRGPRRGSDDTALDQGRRSALGRGQAAAAAAGRAGHGGS